MNDKKCKICRRVGIKLLLKGDRCSSPKCSFVKRPYAPGTAATKRPKSLSEYGKELKEKQKLRNWYNLRESQFSGYVKEVLSNRHKVKDTVAFLIQLLESRLDNTVFRLGFAISREEARQLVNHGHFLVNGKSVDIPSYRVKNGDKISVKVSSIDSPKFRNLLITLKKYKAPSWLKLDDQKIEGVVVGSAIVEEVALPVEISSIFEYYSR